jgi:3-methylfumaryl-CoA hydratase
MSVRATDTAAPSAEAARQDLSHLREWIGKVEQARDTVHAAPVAALSATLDRADPPPRDGDRLPELWHWLYFLPLARHSELGPDGHAQRGRFLPPVPLPRRMWAGSRLDFVQPLHIGEAIERTSTITRVEEKQGRTGRLVLLTVKHEVNGAAGLAIVEEQDLVYRERARAGEPSPEPVAAPAAARWRRTIVPDPVLLFRYSALTFNGHRIHYDRSYVTEVEGYPGLVVHGPLTATLLLDLVRRELPSAAVKRIEFRGMRPLFDLHRFEVCGDASSDGALSVWAQDHEGWLASKASVTLR